MVTIQHWDIHILSTFPCFSYANYSPAAPFWVGAPGLTSSLARIILEIQIGPASQKGRCPCPTQSGTRVFESSPPIWFSPTIGESLPCAILIWNPLGLASLKRAFCIIVLRESCTSIALEHPSPTSFTSLYKIEGAFPSLCQSVNCFWLLLPSISWWRLLFLNVLIAFSF